MTIKSYYKNFLNLYGLLAAVIGGLPFLSKLLPEDWAQYVFPPLGTPEPFARAATLIIAGVITLLVYFSKDSSFVDSNRGRKRALWLVFAIAVMAFIVFFVLTQMFVRTLAVPSVHKSIVVSIGYERTDFARTTFKDASDEQMLRARGATEEEIWRLWTSKSTIVARLGLFVSYLVFIMLAVAFISLGVLFDRIGPPTNN